MAVVSQVLGETLSRRSSAFAKSDACEDRSPLRVTAIRFAIRFVVLPLLFHVLKCHPWPRRLRVPLIPLIPFLSETQRIGETVETGEEVTNVLATRMNTGYYR